MSFEDMLYAQPEIMQQPPVAPIPAQKGLGALFAAINPLGKGGETFRNAIAPIDPNLGVDPSFAKAQQRLAAMRLAAGVAGGRGLGQGLSQGIEASTNQYQAAMENAYNSNLKKKQIEVQQQHYANQLEQQKLAQSRWESEQQAQKDWHDQQLARQEAERKALEDYRARELELRKLAIDTTSKNTQETQGRAEDKLKQQLRKEYRSLQSVKDMESVLPIYESAKKAPDNGAGDLQLIYSVGKLLDPGSVVREGELNLVIASGTPLQRILGTTRFTAEKGGRLPPEQRAQLMGMLNERVSGYRQAYERDFNQYKNYASDSGFKPEEIVGTPAESAYKAPAAVTQAPPAAVEYLRQHPEAAEQFKQKYGYLPGQ